MAGRSDRKLVVHKKSFVDEPAEPPKPIGTKEELERFLWAMLRTSTETRYIDIECEKCPGFKHRVEVTIPGSMAGLKAAQDLWDRMEGKPSAQKPKAEAPRVDPSKLDELTDEQLDAIIAAGGVSTDD